MLVVVLFSSLISLLIVHFGIVITCGKFLVIAYRQWSVMMVQEKKNKIKESNQGLYSFEGDLNNFFFSFFFSLTACRM